MAVSQLCAEYEQNLYMQNSECFFQITFVALKFTDSATNPILMVLVGLGETSEAAFSLAALWMAGHGFFTRNLLETDVSLVKLGLWGFVQLHLNQNQKLET